MAQCDLGVGCEEAGRCYASAQGKPEQCGRLITPIQGGEAPLSAHVMCESCDGSGEAPADQVCGDCDGLGGVPPQ